MGCGNDGSAVGDNWKGADLWVVGGRRGKFGAVEEGDVGVVFLANGRRGGLGDDGVGRWWRLGVGGESICGWGQWKLRSFGFWGWQVGNMVAGDGGLRGRWAYWWVGGGAM